jgi:hypothetical protein
MVAVVVGALVVIKNLLLKL